MTNYLFNEKTYTDIDELMSDIDDYLDAHSIYDDVLDETYGEIDICGCEYAASVALPRVDECAYNCGRNDYMSGVLEDMKYEIERLSDSETYSNYDIEVECIEEDEDDDESEDEL